MNVHTEQIKVRLNECDGMGIVFNANFLVYIDVAITQLWETQFGSYQNAVEKFDVDMVLGSITVDFHAPAYASDLLDVTVEITKIGTTSFLFKIGIMRDSTQVLSGSLRYVCIDRKTAAKTAVPDDLREALLPA